MKTLYAVMSVVGGCAVTPLALGGKGMIPNCSRLLVMTCCLCMLGPALAWGQDTCGDAGAGSCCENTGTPGCDDNDCCAAVCGIDPFCCDVGWDLICAGAACSKFSDLCGCCPTGGCPGEGDCCTAHDTPGCDDEFCCTIICNVDPFCCDISWDGLCVTAACEDPGVCLPPTAGMDIKPGSCPNPLNCGSNGVIPIAIIGTDDLDVTQVDVSTLRAFVLPNGDSNCSPIAVPPGPGPEIEDVATPFDGELCDCHDLNGDGVLDLVLKFRTSECCDKWGDPPGGAEFTVTLIGNLVDGTLFIAADCMVAVPPAQGATVSVGSNVPDTWIDTTPDLYADAGGFGDFGRVYVPGSLVALTAPATSGDLPFYGWFVDGVLNSNNTTITVVTPGEWSKRNLHALYRWPRLAKPLDDTSKVQQQEDQSF